MPLWETYEVEAHVTYTVKCNGKLVTTGMAPGDGRGTSNRDSGGKSMYQAVAEAVDQAKGRALASVRGSEALRRKELGHKDGN